MKRTIKLTILIIAAALVLFVLLVVGMKTYVKFGIEKPAESNGHEFMTSLFQGDLQKAYDLTTPNAQKNISITTFTTNLKNYKSSGAKLTSETLVLTNNNSQADYLINVSGVGKSNFSARLHLVKEKGKWLIDSLSTS